ncbi:MAG: hypothetical protein NC517_09045 [Firmicutes bacterium]|nr:hypothetical protein [Bacillota bacterium]
MLGKTNITTLTEGAVVTEIEDFKWVRMQPGVYGNFVKAIYENGYLAAITADGKVVYTTDGEAWQVSELEYADCKLEDIAWDGSRFLLVGSYKDTIEMTDGTSGEFEIGLLLTTDNFTLYDYFKADTKKIISQYNYEYCSKYLAVYPSNGKWVVLAHEKYAGNSTSIPSKSIAMLVGGSDSQLERQSSYIIRSDIGTICIGKNSQGILITNAYESKGRIYLVDGNTFKIQNKSLSGTGTIHRLPVFDCKDELYYMGIESTAGYKLAKVLFSGEEIILSTGIDYRFIGGVYFNKCQLFINEREMMILKKGESITDKTQEDLIEIAPENTLTCITKAFGQLFVFGNQGLILKSSTEGSSEEAILIQTISAKKALLEANAYTEQRCKLLESKIAALEAEIAGTEVK